MEKAGSKGIRDKMCWTKPREWARRYGVLIGGCGSWELSLVSGWDVFPWTAESAEGCWAVGMDGYGLQQGSVW